MLHQYFDATEKTNDQYLELVPLFNALTDHLKTPSVDASGVVVPDTAIDAENKATANELVMAMTKHEGRKLGKLERSSSKMAKVCNPQNWGSKDRSKRKYQKLAVTTDMCNAVLPVHQYVPPPTAITGSAPIDMGR